MIQKFDGMNMLSKKLKKFIRRIQRKDVRNSPREPYEDKRLKIWAGYLNQGGLQKFSMFQVQTGGLRPRCRPR